jgi:outer membrane protein OmpA-like peptidoglycan-associated protein
LHWLYDFVIGLAGRRKSFFAQYNPGKKDAMRQGWALLLILCTFGLAACAGTSNPCERSDPAASKLDYLDRQKVELQTCLGRFNGTEIERHEKGVFITIRSDTLFESDSDRIKPTAGPEIDTVADVVKKYPETNIVVDAHTDCIRSEEENLALTELQAWTIKKALVDRGVAPGRVKARGWGESKPVASNATEEGRHMNRRITIKLSPTQS